MVTIKKDQNVDHYGKAEEVANLFHDPGSAIGLEQEENRHENQAEEEQHDDIPEMQPDPAEISTEAVPTLEIMRDELPEGASEIAVGKPLDIDLDGNVGEIGDEQGNEEPHHFILQEFTGSFPGWLLQAKIDSRPGNHKNKRHHPQVHEVREGR